MDETFDKRADRFGSTFERLTTPTKAFGFRITAMPKDRSLDIDAVMERAPHLIKGLEKQAITIARYHDENRAARVVGLEDIHRVPQRGWQCQLRGARSESSEDSNLPYYAYLELRCTGLVEFGWASILEDYDLEDRVRTHDLYTDYLTVELANVMGWAEALRELAQVGWAPYEVEAAVHIAAKAQLRVFHGRAPKYPTSELQKQHFAGFLSEPVTHLPRCSFRDLTVDPLSRVERDLCHVAGIGSFSGSLQIETDAP